MARPRGPVIVLAGALGLVAGWFWGQHHLGRHRSDLFSPRPLRRLSALGYLAGQGGIETVRLLQDYLTWERQPLLRRRAERIVRRLEATLS